MKAIRRSRKAEQDLLAIWLAIAVSDQAAGDRVLDEIEQGWRQLARYPLSGVAREDIGNGIRHLVSGRYLSLYRVTETAIEIVRVMHGHREIKGDDL